MRGFWLVLGAFNGLIAVAAGAFGAHALKNRLAQEHLAIFETAARYQMYHGLAMLAVAMQVDLRPRRLIIASVWCMLVGVLFFSGSLYGLALTHGDWRWLGPVTPIGGTLLMIGWLLILICGGQLLAASRNETNRQKLHIEVRAVSSPKGECDD